MDAGEETGSRELVSDAGCCPVEADRVPRVRKPTDWRQPAVITAAGVLWLTGLVFAGRLRQVGILAELGVFLPAYFLAGRPVVTAAFRNLLRGSIFDENLLMTIATVGAFAIRQFPEAVGVMLFFSLGEYFQSLAVKRSRGSIAALMDIRPDYANLQTAEGIQRVDPEEVAVDDLIVVRPGEKIPLDGRITEGSSLLDTSALTGESVPRKVEAGEKVLAGIISTTGLLTVRVEKTFGESSVARILRLVENAAGRKAPTEKFMTKFARYYTPGVVTAAAALAFLPPLLVPGAPLAAWVNRALILLVISCPCALVVSIPLGYFGGIGGSSRNGILVKGANFLEALADLKTVVFDKTGTLTRGVFQVSRVVPAAGFSQGELLRAAAFAEAYSHHPIAVSILKAYGKPVDRGLIEHYEEVSGHGVKAMVAGTLILAGNERLLRRERVTYNPCETDGTVVHVAVGGQSAGHIVISDQVKGDAAAAVRELRDLGIQEIVMLTGDAAPMAGPMAARIGIDRWYAGLLPEHKVARVEELTRSLAGTRGKLAFVGDGINDAPVIARADVGVAMGGLGSDAAIEAADVVIMDDRLARLPAAIRIARRTRAIVIQNVFFALVVKGFFIVFGSLGLANIWEAVFADVGVALLAILNSTRALRTVGFRLPTSPGVAGKEIGERK